MGTFNRQDLTFDEGDDLGIDFVEAVDGAESLDVQVLDIRGYGVMVQGVLASSPSSIRTALVPWSNVKAIYQSRAV